MIGFDYDKFRERLNDFMLSVPMGPIELSRACELDYLSIVHYLKGKTKPHLKTIAKLKNHIDKCEKEKALS